MGTDINIRITGRAGQGIHVSGGILSRMVVAAGRHFHVTQDYMSRIRGGRNSQSIRVMDVPVRAGREDADILLALDRAHVEHFLPAVRPGGVVLCDPAGEGGGAPAGVPLMELAVAAGKPVLANMVGVGMVARLLGLAFETADRFLQLEFQGDILEMNRRAVRAGLAWAESGLPVLSPLPGGKTGPRVIVSGSEAAALGALAGGCKFAAGYPMTPGSGILEGLSMDGPLVGLVFEQAEDEIAALNMAIGASYTGARAMVSTSGGGFALMGEALSLAGMLETPVVIALGMRPGPATGMPTRTAQEDLSFALYAGHGEFPRIVLSPGSAEEAFALAYHAMEASEAHQVPCILLTDQFLADTIVDVAPEDLAAPPVRRRIVTGKEVPRGADGKYLRYALTESGLSPMAVPGEPGITVVADSDEHTEDGHLTEDHGVRLRMEEKRARKEKGLDAGVLPPLLSGPPEGELALIGFGSTKGAVAEAREILAREGVAAAAVHLRQVAPFPSGAIERIFERYGAVLTVENNRTGQLARLIRAETGRKAAGIVSRCDGLPFTASDLVRRIKERTS